VTDGPIKATGQDIGGAYTLPADHSRLMRLATGTAGVASRRRPTTGSASPASPR